MSGLQFYSTPEKPQHMKALDKANAKRREVGHFKAMIRAKSTVDGLEWLAEFFVSDIPESLDGMRIVDAITSVHRIGHDKARKALFAARIQNGVKPVRSMPPRQRQALSDALIAMAEKWREDHG
jgi:hypothetical protein